MADKTLMILAVAAIAYLVFFASKPETQSALKFDESAKTFSRGERLEYPYPDWELASYSGPAYTGQFDDLDLTGDNKYTLDDYELFVYGDYATYGEYGETGYTLVNKCGYSSYGYPDYIGTEKEGMTCADMAPDEQNNECVLNVPYNFEGIVSKVQLISDPTMTCCVADGTCQWVVR